MVVVVVEEEAFSTQLGCWETGRRMGGVRPDTNQRTSAQGQPHGQGQPITR